MYISAVINVCVLIYIYIIIYISNRILYVIIEPGLFRVHIFHRREQYLEQLPETRPRRWRPFFVAGLPGNCSHFMRASSAAPTWQRLGIGVERSKIDR